MFAVTLRDIVYVKNRHFSQGTADNILPELFNISRKLLSPVKKCKKSLVAGMDVSRIMYEIMYAKRPRKEEI